LFQVPLAALEILSELGRTASQEVVEGLRPIRQPSELNSIPPMLPHSRTNLMTIHLFSSCPMGENKSRCAVDSYGKLHNFNGLYIADASLLCTSPGVNPQGTIMAITRRNVLHYLSQN